MMPFEAGDLINIMMSVEVPDEGLGIEAIHPTGEPLIPSIIFSMHKIKDTVAGLYHFFLSKSQQNDPVYLMFVQLVVLRLVHRFQNLEF